MTKRKIITFSLVVGIFVSAIIIWVSFRKWESRNDDSLPVPYLSYVRKPNDQTDKLIVFVHGFGTDAQSAWTSDRTHVYWPELIANDGDLSSFAVLTTSYSSPLLRHAGTIEQAAVALGTKLKDEGVYTRYSQIVFIAHSMGGLITRRMLVQLLNSGDEAALRRVAIVFFFGTPTSGAPDADTVDWFSANPQTHDLSGSEVNTLLQSVDNDWENLVRQRIQRTEGHPQVYCGYELRSTRIRWWLSLKVVPALYAKTTCDEAPFPFDRDHFTLVKPDNDQDDVYQWTKKRLLGPVRIGSVTWTGGETLGELVTRLHKAYVDGRARVEDVRFSAPFEHVVSELWISPADYRRESWGELFRTVARDHPCFSVNIGQQGHLVELAQAGPIKRCGARTICETDKCDRTH